MDKWNRAFGVGVVCGLMVIAGQLPGADGPPTNVPPTAAVVSATVAPGGPDASNPSNVTAASTALTNAPTGTNANSGLNPGGPTVAFEEMAARYSADILRSHLRLQEQLHTALLAIQHSRAEASAEAQTNVTAMLGRLEALENELAGQRAQEAVASRNSNRLMMLAAAGMFLIGVLAMVLTAVIQARGMNRLAEIALGLGSARGLPGLPAPGVIALPVGDRLLLGDPDARANTGRLESTIRQLEGRIRDMEAATESGAIQNGHGDAPGANSVPLANGMSTNSPAASPRAVMLAKAQALLNLGQPQAALVAMDDAIKSDPNDAELHLRRGMALERLRRFDQAIEACDRAIAIDSRCTQAYLSKGSVLNQQSRYQEALACYEQALEHRVRPA
jgi:tetratricopeptide (TPR) repeat protein